MHPIMGVLYYAAMLSGVILPGVMIVCIIKGVKGEPNLLSGAIACICSGILFATLLTLHF